MPATRARRALTLRLTAACVALAAVLSLPGAGARRAQAQAQGRIRLRRQEQGCQASASLRRRDLPHAGAGGGRQRAARGVLHPPDLAGEPLRSVGRQPGRRAGHRAVHAANRRDARAHQRLRAAAGAARVGELPARAAHDLPRQPGPGRGRLQCRPRPGRSLARRPRRLPVETQAYVRIVTGYSAEAWTSQPTPQMRVLGRADGRSLRRARQADDRRVRAASRPHRRPGLGPVGCPACRQLVRRTVSRHLRAAAAQVRGRPGRPAAADPAGAPLPTSRPTPSASRKRAAPTPMRCARSCAPPAAPASFSAIRATRRPHRRRAAHRPSGVRI